ncbi:HNH endonuclease [Salmonella enterica]|nr:HNH endonuclease [Salmonella enterica]
MSELDYDPETGLFTWKVTNRLGFVGKQAGCFCPRDGYIRIRINNKLELAHRLAWNMTYPEDPVGPDEQIDHINHVRTDNRIINLRKASNTENSRNSSIATNNTSGATGVWFEKRRKAWVAEIKVDRKKVHIGQFEKFADAVHARKAAEVKYGFHENHGKKRGM